MSGRTEQRIACVLLSVGLALGSALHVSGCASPRSVGRSESGGLEPYRMHGRTYEPLPEWRGYAEEGMASWYGAFHHGKRTANGERYDAYGSLTAAHKTLPFHVCAKVENLRTGRSVIVRINDRGPFARGRLIDLSRAAASQIGLLRAGVARVRVEAVGVADAQGRCANA